MSQSISTRLAAVICACLMVLPDIIASNHAIQNMWNSKATEAVSFFKYPEKAFVKRNVQRVKKRITAVKEEKQVAVFQSLDSYGVIGYCQEDPSGNPYDDIFRFLIDSASFSEEKAGYLLEYELLGLKDGAAIPKSFNNGTTFGTENYQRSEEWNTVQEYVDKSELKAGLNVLRFSLPKSGLYSARIKNAQLTVVEKGDLEKANYTLQAKEIISSQLFQVLPGGQGEVLYQLSDIHTPSIPRNIINVTANAYAYSYKGENVAKIGIAIDENKVPGGSAIDEVNTYFFDYNARKWTVIPVDSLDVQNAVNFVPDQGPTQYFNGLIKTPEMPDAGGFTPTTIQGIKAANPSEGMAIMQPPGISKSGDANITYPLVIPPGRNGMAPALALTYSSAKGTGWLGVGWDLNIPKVTVDTRWGVPTFDTKLESESYLLHGQSLRMEGNIRINRPDKHGVYNTYNRSTRSEVRFFQKNMNQYKEIVRKGSEMAGYYWVETTADQTKYYYGTTDGLTLDDDAVLKDENGNIVEWYLRKVEDKWGNYILYNYQSYNLYVGSGSYFEGAYGKHISSISYTGHTSTGDGKYTIHFTVSDQRDDATLDLRYGFRKLDALKLQEVVVKYNGVEQKKYSFDFTEGKFAKQLLTKISEYRHGVFFYDHDLEYHAGNSNYDVQEVEFNAETLNLFNESLAISLLETNKSFTKNTGIYIGAGTPPPTDVTGYLTKSFTAGATSSSGSGYNQGLRQMADVNGDGLLDFIYKDENGVKFTPLRLNASGLSLRPERSMTGLNTFSYAYTNSNSTEFQLNISALFSGTNTITTNQQQTTYLNDYNADGITDVVNNSNVYFGALDAQGNVSYSGNSSLTPNPVVKGADAIEPTIATPGFQDLELVKSWIAPFDGTVTISGDAVLSSDSEDGVLIAIQKNGTFIKNFTAVSAGATETVYSIQTVNKGDQLFFRVNSNDNGFDDDLTWNPQVQYTNVFKNDGNGTDLTNTSYQQGFILSEQDEVILAGNDEIQISWPTYTHPATSDQVTYIVEIKILDDQGQLSGTLEYSHQLAAHQSANLNIGDLVLKGLGFPLSSQPTVLASDDDEVYISFKVKSSSNVNWKSLNWRPQVIVEQASNGETYTDYPAVDYGVYQKVIKHEDVNVLGAYLNEPYGQVYPVFDPGILSELSAMTLTNPIKASFVIKSNGYYLREISLNFSPTGITYTDPISQQTFSPGTYQWNQLLNTQIQTPLYIEFYTTDVDLANVLGDYTVIEYADAFPVDPQNGYIEVVTDDQLFNVYLGEENSITGPDYLGWGQFVWSNFGSQDPINPAQVEFPDLDPSSWGIDENTPVEDYEGILVDGGVDPNDVKTVPLCAMRSEELNSSFYLFDQWAIEPDIAVTDTKFKPGKQGDIQNEEEILTPPNSIYGGKAAVLYSTSTTKSHTETVVVGYSETYASNINNNRKSRTLNGFWDVNGDRYPDILLADNLNLQVQSTNNIGSLDANRTTMDNMAALHVSWPQKWGPVLDGSFINEKSSSNGAMSNGFNEVKFTWIDINGDGLPDRVNSWNTANETKVQFNAGGKLLSEIKVPSLNQRLPSSDNHSVSINYTFKNICNGSIQAGFGGGGDWNETKRMFSDVNGDGLTDLIDVENEKLYVNTGSAFKTISWGFPSLSELQQGYGLSISRKFAGTASLVIGSVKTSLSVSTESNNNATVAKVIPVDVNSDGYLDFVRMIDAPVNAKVQVYLSQMANSNLLKSVDNPIGGKFTLNYKAIGNRYGSYPGEIETGVKTPTYAHEVLWDMPINKQVLASVTVDDGVLNQQSDDIDGFDQYTTTFDYEGGIYSRREREFLGFTRIATHSPNNEASTGGSEMLNYVSTVQQFREPTGFDYKERIAYEYVCSLLDAEYTLLNAYIEETDGVYSEGFLLNNVTQNEYTIYEINQDVSQTSSFNTAILDDDIDLTRFYDEAACLFTALTKTESFHFKELKSTKFHSSEYTLAYDKYLNVIRAVDGGESYVEQATEQVVGQTQEEVPVDIKELVLVGRYQAPIIALMHYFGKSASSNQTNLLRKHRIFVNDTAKASMRRKSTVDALQNKLAASEISQWLDAVGTNKPTSLIQYNTNGTVARVQGPPNQENQAYWQRFTYDADNSQYVVQVSNAYGDQSCMTYRYGTGQLESVKDPNGYINFFSFDTQDRISEVFAPREYQDVNTPYTIHFDYYPEGKDGSTVPVAITTHYVGEAAEAIPAAQACGTTGVQSRSVTPRASDLIETATFIDGMQRVVQVKKESAKFNTATGQNETVRQLSGWTAYNWLGQEDKVTMAGYETTAGNLIGVLNTANNVREKANEYDLASRVTKVILNTDDVNEYYEIANTYAWGSYNNNDYFTVGSFDGSGLDAVAGGYNKKAYNTSKGRTILTQTLSGSGSSSTIETMFDFDALGQLLSTTNALLQTTSFTYDWLGRNFQEVHPDRGTTTLTFDKAGNVTQKTTANGTFNMAYDYNRLKGKEFPVSGTINNLTYTYGSYNDGNNGAGRVTQVVQGDNVLVEDFVYDELGNVSQEKRTIAVPLVGEVSFLTQYKYDSWGRLRLMIYPDAEEVTYSYAGGGELESVVSSMNFTQTTNLHEYVSKIGYDGLGKRSHLLYGNGTLTELAYKPQTQRVASVVLNTADKPNIGITTLLNKSFNYYKNGFVQSISNTASSFGTSASVTWNDLGGKYNNTYEYDYAQRLSFAINYWKPQEEKANYELTMNYNKVGGITNKLQKNNTQTPRVPDLLNYVQAYTYNSTKAHQLDKTSKGGADYLYTYDSRGNVESIEADDGIETVTQYKHIWDEEDRLVSTYYSDNGNAINHSVYDAAGMRILKTQIRENGQYQNGQGQGPSHYVDPYLVYVNPYYVCRFYDDEQEISKHYFAGAERVASRLYQRPYGPVDYYNGDEQMLKTISLGGDPSDYFSQEPEENNIILSDLESVLSEHNIGLTETDIITEGLGAIYTPELGDYEPCFEQPDLPMKPEDTKFTELQYRDCLCRFLPIEAQDFGIQCDIYNDVYWYHSDYLGHTEFITDIGGYPYQFFYYTAFGEMIEDQNANNGKYNTPYRFNGKELDEETGLYYYGARYYNPQTSIWLGVDPLSSNYPALDPFSFTGLNPNNFVDFDGRHWGKPGDEKSKKRDEETASKLKMEFAKSRARYQSDVTLWTANLENYKKSEDFDPKSEEYNEMRRELWIAKRGVMEMDKAMTELDEMRDSKHYFTFKPNRSKVMDVIRPDYYENSDGTITFVIPYSTEMLDFAGSAGHEVKHIYIWAFHLLKGGKMSNSVQEKYAYVRQWFINPSSLPFPTKLSIIENDIVQYLNYLNTMYGQKVYDTTK